MNHEVMLKLPKITIFSMRRSCILHLCIYIYSEHFWLACVIWCRTNYYFQANSIFDFRWSKLTESELLGKKGAVFGKNCSALEFTIDSVWLQMQPFVSGNFRTENEWRETKSALYFVTIGKQHTNLLLKKLFWLYANVLHDVHRMSAILKEIII